MKIGSLKAGCARDEVLDKHSDYDVLFKRLLVGRGFDFTNYPELDGVLHSNVDAADVYQDPGFKFSVNECHGWILPLEEFLRTALAKSVPIVGVCLGSQILAQALADKVEKFVSGWSVGATEFDNHGGTDCIMAWHQDQVVEPPKEAKILSSSEFCQHAMLSYGSEYH